MTNGRQLKCDACKQVFVAAWTDAEARKEQESNFPGLAPKYQSLVCDDCYKKLMAKFGPWQ